MVHLSLEILCQISLHTISQNLIWDLNQKEHIVTDATVVVTTSNPIPFTQTIQIADILTVPTHNGTVFQPQVVETKALTYADFYL